MSTNVREYIGSRYVPIFGRKDEESITWDNTKPYEPLTIVLYQGNSYTSRQYVPVGVEITNGDFWALTGNYNAQVEAYRREVEDYTEAYGDAIDALEDFVAETVIGFDTVADMKASTILEDGMICHTNGFHSSGDGGAGYYKISNSGTANEMDVIACQDSLLAHFVITEPFVTPEQFGAYGDGTHDDYNAINKAVSYKNVSMCANKTYKVSIESSIELSGNTHINMNGSTIIYDGINSCFHAENVGNIIIENGTIGTNEVYDVDAPPCYCIFLESCTNINISGMNFINAITSGIDMISCKFVSVNNSYFYHNHHYGISDTGGEDNIYQGNIFYKNGYDSEETDSGYGRGIVIRKSKRIIIDSNTFDSNSEYGVRLYRNTDDISACVDTIISDNIFKENKLIDLYCYNESNDYLHDNIVVSGNIFESIGSACCSFSFCDNIVFNGNKMNGTNTTAAISLINSKKANIENNTVRNYNNFVVIGTHTATNEYYLFKNNDCIINQFLPNVNNQNIIIDGNIIKALTSGKTAIEILLSPITVSNNEFIGFNRAIQLNVIDGLNIINNFGSDNTQLIYYYEGTGTSYNIYGNSGPTNVAGFASLHALPNSNFAKKTLHSNATPTFGIPWKVGDIVFNTVPGAPNTGIFAWICITDGTGNAAVWKTVSYNS